MEQYELELVADEIEKLLANKDNQIDFTRRYIFEKFINEIRSNTNQSDIDDFLNEFAS